MFKKRSLYLTVHEASIGHQTAAEQILVAKWNTKAQLAIEILLQY